LRDACKEGTGLFDYSLTATVLGGFTILAIVGTSYNLYTRNKNGSDKVEQA
jgi:hypothetical protein